MVFIYAAIILVAIKSTDFLTSPKGFNKNSDCNYAPKINLAPAQSIFELLIKISVLASFKIEREGIHQQQHLLFYWPNLHRFDHCLPIFIFSCDTLVVRCRSHPSVGGS
jgi:hypothetical protein